MKSMQIAVLLLLAAAVFVSGAPRVREVESVEDDAEEIPLPEVPAIAVPAGPGFGYIPSFYSFFPDVDLVSRIRGLVTRLRTQIGDSFGDIDWSKGNTTSTTKIIDGHVVTVNETSYKDEDTDLVLHVKVIDVKPTEGAEEDADVSSEATSPKESNNEAEVEPTGVSSEDTEGNEIPKQPEVGVAESHEFDLVYNPEETRDHHAETREMLDYLDELDTPDSIVDNSLESFIPNSYNPLIPMNDDIRVNHLKAESGDIVMIPEDVELFEPDDRNLYTVNENKEYVYNPKDVYETAQSENFCYRPRSESIKSFT